MILSWAAATADCHGGPEVVVGYSVMVLAIWIAGWYDCTMPGEPEQWCPMYAYSPWMEVLFTEGLSLDLAAMPIPPVGGVDVYRIEAVDHAGNRSDQPCDP